MRYLVALVLLSLQGAPGHADTPSALDRLAAEGIPVARQFPGQPKELIAVLGEPRPLLEANFDRLHKLFAVAFSPNGKTLAYSCSDNTVRLVDLTIGEPKERSVPSGRKDDRWGFALSLAFAPDSKTLGIATKTVALWDLTGAEPRERFMPKDTYAGIIHQLAFAPDGKWLAGSCFDHKVRLWDLSQPEPKEKAVLESSWKRTGTNRRSRMFCVAIAPDGKTLACGSFDGTLKLWDLAGPQPKEREVTLTHRTGVFCVAFAPDGQSVAAGSRHFPAVRLRALSGDKVEELTSFEKHGGLHLRCLSFSPDGKTVAGSDYELPAQPDEGANPPKGRVFLWDVRTGKKLQEWELPGAQAVAFAPDGRHLAIARNNSTVCILRLATH